MLFQTLDEKSECPIIYADKKFSKIDLKSDLTHTWDYCGLLKNLDIDYANLFVEGKSLEDSCPEHLKIDYNEIIKKLKAIINSFVQAKINMNDSCFYDLVPKNFLQDYCELKNKICLYVFDNYKKPIEYEFLLKFTKIITDIKNRKLNVDLECLKPKLADNKTLQFYKKMYNQENYISYNLFGSITGRLTTAKNSFPIQTLSTQYRSIIKPTNDWFVAFDMNAAELRTSLGLLEKTLPEEDLYELLKNDIFNDSLSRAEVKKATTSWLYNINNTSEYSEKLDDVFEKDRLLNSYWDGKYVYTPFNRKIESDKFHAIPYLNQSTFIDLFHRQAIKVDDFLKDKKSFISFFLHDEIVLDFTDDEKEYIINLIKILEDTQFGKYIVNVKVGKDFGSMKKLKLKV